MMGADFDSQTVEPHEIAINVCVMFYKFVIKDVEKKGKFSCNCLIHPNV